MIDRLDAALLAWRDRLTPGQRWTSAVLASVALAVLLFGAPGVTVVVPAAPVSAAPPAADRPAFEIAIDPPPVASPSAPEAAPAPSTGGEAAASAEPVPVAAPAAVAPLRITALLPAPSPTALPGRGEADIAEVFLLDAGLDVRARATVEDPAACEAVGGERTLVLGPAAVGDDLRACLQASGATLLAFHEAGTGDGLLSTRRARATALLELGRWAAATDDVLDGRVGIVGAEADEAWLAPLLPALEAAGLDVVASAFVADAAVSQAVRDFVTAGVDGVVLAAPAGLRQQWTAQHAVLDGAVRFVVADVHDGVTSEAYAPTFDGALAHTSLRGAWHARAHGESPEQVQCRETWEAAATPPRMLAGETQAVFAWCQHAELAAAVVAAGTEPADVPAVLRMPSPLTSALGPLPDDGWGPQGTAIVVWRAACGCWEEQVAFRSPR